MIRRAGLLLAAAILCACGSASEPPDAARPTAVVLVIGDGMGIAQITFARLLELGPGERFDFERLPRLGLVSTYSGSNRTTESAAAATAISSGIKTDNKAIGVDLEGRPVTGLGELARRAGWSVGIVTTTSLTHATPAAFYGHVANRYDDEPSLPMQLIRAGPDVALGGGLGWFLPSSDPRSLREDDTDALAAAREAGYTVATTGDELAERRGDGPLLGVFAREHLTFELDRRRDPELRGEPTLEAMTRAALRTLTARGRPFFLMVEGGRIDHAAHSFDPPALAAEVAALDRAIDALTEYRAAHPDTLVVVTADHATGGLAINDFVDWERLERQRASHEWICERIVGEGAGTELVAEMTGFEGTTEADLARIRAEAETHPVNAQRALGRVLSEWHGVTWVPRLSPETWGHTGEDVAIFAAGPGAERFAGVIDNTDIPRALRELAGWPSAETAPPPHPEPASAAAGPSATPD